MISARARYMETKRPNGTIHDSKTVEILDAIEYDFKELSITALHPQSRGFNALLYTILQLK
jgi:hypothetical protein